MFDRLDLLIGEDKRKELGSKNILLIGVGGVGSFTLEALIRSGILNITIADGDVVDITNLNRQLIALKDNVGMPKVEVAKKRALSINDEAHVNIINKFLTEDDLNNLDYDYVIDATDDRPFKKALIKYCYHHKIKLISSMGMGKRFNPSMIEITDIHKTSYDPIARDIRAFCRSEGIKKLTVVSSKEKAQDIKAIGTFAPVPASAGLLIASHVILDLLNLTV